MKTFIVTKEYTVVHTDKYEVEADSEEQAIEMVQEGDFESFYEEDECVHVDFDAQEL